MRKTSFVLFCLLMLVSALLNATQMYVVGEVFSETW
jgi:hypothetical protein